MNRPFACLLMAGLTSAAQPHAVMSASTVRHPVADVDVLVGGSAQPRIPHNGRWYVEALKGREYAIRLRNPYGVRVAVALAVDGLNTIDARHTTAAAARKWVLDPYETIVISGWQTSRSEARRFEFTTEDHSYARSLGRTADLGVISAVYFRERVPALTQEAAGDSARQQMPAPRSASPGRDAAAVAKGTDDEYAATGMGRRADHAVTEVRLDLERTPAQAVNIRYEFRAALIRLGVVPATSTTDALDRRERASGFEAGFAPEPPGHR
jgi:hypothetical protein